MLLCFLPTNLKRSFIYIWPLMEAQKKNKTLATLVELLRKNKSGIMAANKQDIANCGDIDASLFDRLKVDDKKVDAMIASVEQVMNTDDPEGKILYTYHPANGLNIENRTVPFGRILIIYESRPDVTIEAASAAFKAGNTILLKGGKEAKQTNIYLVQLWQQALCENGLNRDIVTYLDLKRTETQDMIVNNTQRLDLVIPRGGEGLIQFVTSNTDIPVIVSGRGNNFLYVDDEADFNMALNIIVNGKQRLSVCNALDKVLFSDSVLNLPSKMPALVKALNDKGITVYGFENIRAMDKNINPVEDDGMMGEEFLSAKILFSMVQNLEEAISTINKYSGKHSATIVTDNKQKAKKFQEEVDCAAVYHNASTRFTDGGEFGFGAEIAISTQKLHFRGPVGLEQLVTNKWFISGDGQVRG